MARNQSDQTSKPLASLKKRALLREAVLAQMERYIERQEQRLIKLYQSNPESLGDQVTLQQAITILRERKWRFEEKLKAIDDMRDEAAEMRNQVREFREQHELKRQV